VHQVVRGTLGGGRLERTGTDADRNPDDFDTRKPRHLGRRIVGEQRDRVAARRKRNP
jgi:hypothetical protein